MERKRGKTEKSGDAGECREEAGRRSARGGGAAAGAGLQAALIRGSSNRRHDTGLVVRVQPTKRGHGVHPLIVAAEATP